MNPFTDAFSFLFRSGWPTVVFWLLLAGSVAIALINLYRDPWQRTAAHLWMWIARLFIGGLWWQQSLWKLPPTYTDNPDGISGGLHYWVGEMAKHAAFGWQSAFVKDVLQPHVYLFAPQVYATEVLIAISLMLGLFARAGGALGALMAINLWLGLYRAPYEWPWTYFFLILLQTTFAVLHAGRSLGIDAILARRETAALQPRRTAARLLARLT
ncbi:MAG: DoxX family protein [Candidatus Methylomirabilis oxyfera]|nr:DoxX family protein [Candidatus Methylomirabilis oxyfera]